MVSSPPPSESRGDGPPWGYILTLGAVLAVGAGLLLLPGLLAPQPGPTATPAPTTDPHQLTTAQGTFATSYEGGAIVIRRLDPSPTVLGRAIVPDEMHPAASGDPLAGGGVWALSCPAVGTEGPVRIMFGTTYPILDARYSGPSAAFAFAPDGLWLVVLDPGDLDPNALLKVEARGGGGGVHVAEFDFALSAGTKQPSGCSVSG